MRYVGYVALLCIGFGIMGASDAEGLRWYISFPLWVTGFIIATEAVRADERHKHGL